MKKIMGIVLAAAIAGTGVSAFAKTEGISYNQQQNKFIIEGSISSGLENKKIKIIVTNPGFTIESLKDNFSNALYYTNEVYAKADGSYEIAVPFSEENVSGEYTFYVQDDEADLPEKLTAYYANEEEKESIIESINNAGEAEMKETLKEAIKILNLDETLVNGVLDEAAELLYNHKTTTPIDKETAKEIIEELAVVAAFNEEKAELLTTDGEYIRNDILDFSVIDKNGVNLYEIYAENMSDEGRKAVFEDLYGNDLKNADELLQKFAESVFINAIKYPKEDGTGHIEEILTKENAEVIEISVDSYLKITNNTQKKNVELDLMKKSFTSVEDFEDKLPGIVSDNKQNTGGGSGGSGGGSSSGGAGSLIVTPVKNNENTEKTGFSDMTNYSWAEEAVNYLYKNGIVSGTGNNMFSPEKLVTREQFAVMLINSLGEDMIENDGKFSDVAAGSYYEKHVATGVKLGIIKGISNGIFGTGRTITRQDLCTLIYRAYFEDEKAENNLEFNDISDISDYALEAISCLEEKGIVNGFSDGTFKPKDACTRAQAAKMLYGAIICSK